MADLLGLDSHPSLPEVSLPEVAVIASEAKQSRTLDFGNGLDGLFRRFAPRNDGRKQSP
jgi:hypothetical protein